MSKVLVACEKSQVVTAAFRAVGIEAYSCDVDPCLGGHPEWHIQGDAVDEAYSRNYCMMIAHPPCTRLTNAGVRWLHEPPKNKTLVMMWRDLFIDAAFYKKLRDAPIRYKCIENPVMHPHAKELINPGKRQVVQPWWFGEKTFKATGFELINLPVLVPTNILIPPPPYTEEHKKWSWVHRMPPGPDRAWKRSITLQGVADAMAQQWGPLVQ